MTRSIYSAMVALAAVLALAVGTKVQAGPRTTNGDYKVLAPIHADNLTIFPVVAATTHDTREFLTLDEGLRSGEVVITELGNRPIGGAVHKGCPAEGHSQDCASSGYASSVFDSYATGDPVVLALRH